MARPQWRSKARVAQPPARTLPEPEPDKPGIIPENFIVPSNSVVASAIAYHGKAPRIYMPARQWQVEAYRHYGICGEARFAAQYFGHALGRARLYAADSLDAKDRLTEGPAKDYLDSLFNGADGQAQMLNAIGVHLTIAGDCYLVGRQVALRDPISGEPTGETDEVWEVLSVLEIGVNGKTWTIKPRDQETLTDIELGDDDVVIRIWTPNPSRRVEADSPFRSLLPILSEIEYLTRHIFAQTTSRLTGAGLMFVSDDIEFPAPLDNDGNQVEFANKATGLMLSLAEGMMRTVQDPGLPSALVPLIATVPAEVLAKGKPAELMHFWTELDKASLEMRQAAVQRFAQGMDLPAEKVLGLSSNSGTGGGNSNGISHWGAWQVDEETIKLHVEPMLDTVTNSITVAFLRPLTLGLEVVRYDTKALRLRPDRSKESIELYNLGLLKGERVLEENGFEVTDMPDAAELKTWLLIKIAGGSSTPEQVAAAAAELGVTLPVGEQEQTREARPDPSLEDHPVRELPERQAASLSTLLLATEPLVYRALERCGNKLRQRTRSGVRADASVPVYEMHTVFAANGLTEVIMDDAFPTAALTLDGVADCTKVVPVLENYVAGLVARQEPHSRTLLSAALEGADL